ncbi:unnamed protein product [Heligmosomoides polygyrus]|uniref:SET domain-containing protein n=1 Tax=Heligmosomoides polygyrus TaxID=6339 RepID=A0A3P7Y4U7_HELPZ|nr:unnamed protein product [Heligmosomoides polygyrus]
MIKKEGGVLTEASKLTNTPTDVLSRKRGRPRKRDQNGAIIVKKEMVDDSPNTIPSLPRKRGRPSKRSLISVASFSLNGSRTPANLSCSAIASECTPSVAASTDTSMFNYDVKPLRDLPDTELVDVHELWDHYLSRAEYQPILASSFSQCPKARMRVHDRKSLIEKITHLKRIEQCIAKGIKQVTTFEFFNYVNPLCPGLNDVATEVYAISCSGDKVIQKDRLSEISVPCRSTHHHQPPVLYYAVPPIVEKNAKSVFLVVKVHIEQKYHYVGSARRLGRSRGEHEVEETDSPVVKRILYGVRKVASGQNGVIHPAFGNHTVVLINSENDHVDGVPFKITEEKWMSNFAHLDLFTKIGNKLCSSGPIGLINFGISDEHVDYDWDMVESIMDARFKRRNDHLKALDVAVWYHHTLPELPVDTGSSSRDSPSSDKENRNARSSPRKAPRSPLKLPVKTLSPRKANGSPKSPIKSPSLQQEHCSPKPPMKVMSPRKCNATPKSPAKSLSPRKASGSPRSPVKSLSSLESSVFLELPSGVFDRVSGWTCPFTGKTFDAVEELEQHLQRSYSAFKFEKIKCSSLEAHFLVSSVISRADWENPPADSEKTKRLSISAISPKRKVVYVPPPEVPTKKKNELPKAQMIPFGEMSFVHPIYSQVPGPSSAKVYHSVIEDTCDWKMHLIERNIRDYIDDTPQEKEFMLLHNRFRSKFRHLIVGEKLTMEFYVSPL